jgi:cytochrome c biogenesis protein CcmG/thiol:disulfide interchange protein DsbE
VRAVAALAATVLLATACTGGGGDSTGVTLPDLELPALGGDGAPLDVGTLSGPAVVNVWATWCGPCRKELPAFQEVSASRPEVRFIGVNSVETGDARPFLDGLGITYEQYVDDAGQLAEGLGAAALPVTIVVGADGSVVTAHLGPMSVDDLEGALAAVS